MKRILSLAALLPLLSIALANEAEKPDEEKKEIPEATQSVTEHSAKIGGQRCVSASLLARAS